MSVISLSDHACTCALIHQGLFAVCARMVLNFLAMALVKLKVIYGIHFQILQVKTSRHNPDNIKLFFSRSRNEDFDN